MSTSNRVPRSKASPLSQLLVLLLAFTLLTSAVPRQALGNDLTVAELSDSPAVDSENETSIELDDEEPCEFAITIDPDELRW